MTKRATAKTARVRKSPAPANKPGIRISDMALSRSMPAQASALATPFMLPKAAPGVLPSADMAMDSDPGLSSLYGWANEMGMGEGLSFFGYPALSELAQRPEYRRMVGTLAQEMTRKFIKLTAKGDDDKSARISELQDAVRGFRVQDVCREAGEHDGFYGVAHIFTDTGDWANPVELQTPLVPKPSKLPKGGLKGFRAIEPIWCYPGVYNANNPLAPDFYRPQHWFVMGTRVHHTRLLTLVSREVPDLLKPAYMFGGISLTQLAKPYVDYWLRTRSSVGDLLESYTIWVLKTNLEATLQGGGGEEMTARAQLFNNLKSSRGLMMLDKDAEDFANVATPLGGLHELQAQSQEHMASVDGMPLIKLLGITPSGLNATAEPELKSWHERVKSQQRHLYDRALTRMLELIQLHLWGEIDPDIGYEWEPLDEVDETERATIRKLEVDADVLLINAGVISPDESRARLAHEPGSSYANLDLNKEIDPPDDGGTDDGEEGDGAHPREPSPDPDGIGARTEKGA